MKMLEMSRELSAAERYALTMSPAVQQMKKAKGETITISAWCIYQDVNKDGKENIILSILSESGEIHATNSPTFINDFTNMQELFRDAGEDVHAITVISGMSKAGREFITCVYAG